MFLIEIMEGWKLSDNQPKQHYGVTDVFPNTSIYQRQNCRLSCRVKLSFRKINGNRRKCTHRTRATSDKIFQATSDKILNFYTYVISCVHCCGKRQFCRLSLALSLPVRSHPNDCYEYMKDNFYYILQTKILYHRKE